MTEPIDQATKDLIKDEAEQWFKNLPWMESYKFQLVKEGYIAGATVWAEKLKQLETQSHDQVRIIEHLEEKLKQERNKAIDECIEVVKSGRWYPATLKELESLKTP